MRGKDTFIVKDQMGTEYKNLSRYIRFISSKFLSIQVQLLFPTMVESRLTQLLFPTTAESRLTRLVSGVFPSGDILHRRHSRILACELVRVISKWGAVIGADAMICKIWQYVSVSFPPGPSISGKKKTVWCKGANVSWESAQKNLIEKMQFY